MAIEKRGKHSYLVRVRPFPSKTFPTRASAQKYELHLRTRLAEGDTWTEPPITLGEAMRSFVERQALGSKPRTTELRKLRAKNWAAWAGHDLNLLKRAEIEDYIYHRADYHPRSAQAELAFLKAVLRDAKGRGQRIDMAILEIPPIKHKPADPQVITLDRVDNIVAWLPTHAKIVPQVAARTGMRQAELFNLIDDDLRLDDRLLFVRDSKTEAGKRTVVLSKAVVSLFREQLMIRPPSRYVFPNEEGARYTRHAFGTLWRKARVRAGETITFRELRNVGVSLMAQADWKLEHIADQVGWSERTQAAMHARYRRLFDGELEERVAALDRLDAKRRTG